MPTFGQDLPEVSAPSAHQSQRPMSPSVIFRTIGCVASFGKIGSYGTFWGKTNNYHFFSKALLPRMLERTVQGKVPPGSAFVHVDFDGKTLLALRVPKKLNGKLVGFDWNLNKNLSAMERGYPHAARRRELLASQLQYHTDADIRRIWKIQSGRCYYSGKSLGPTFESAVFSIDHISPLSRGGHDGPTNLALVAPLVNISKGSKTHAQFLRNLRLGEKQLARVREVDRLRKQAFAEVDRTRAKRAR